MSRPVLADERASGGRSLASVTYAAIPYSPGTLSFSVRSGQRSADIKCMMVRMPLMKSDPKNLVLVAVAASRRDRRMKLNADRLRAAAMLSRDAEITTLFALPNVRGTAIL